MGQSQEDTATQLQCTHVRDMLRNRKPLDSNTKLTNNKTKISFVTQTGTK